MSGASLEVRRSSASLWGEQTGMRRLPVVSKYIDTTTCIGCKACEVACQEWNDLGIVPTRQTGST
jgi:formate dehydrogenase iron-sulfur subunit